MRALLAVGLVLALLNIVVLYGITRQLRHRLDELEMKRAHTDDGICGDEAPVAVGPGAVMVCDLPYGHASEWHSGDRDGRPPMRWRNRGLSGA